MKLLLFGKLGSQKEGGGIRSTEYNFHRSMIKENQNKPC